MIYHPYGEKTTYIYNKMINSRTNHVLNGSHAIKLRISYDRTTEKKMAGKDDLPFQTEQQTNLHHAVSITSEMDQA